MTNDLVKQSILELQDIVRCRCHPAYTGRGLHDPDCECDSAEAVKVVADRIEELEAENARLGQQCEGLMQAAMNNGQALILAEAKLAKAVEVLGGVMRHMPDHPDTVWIEASETLAELKGEKDE